ncbi:hypothetical protein EST38_g4867 [Candolleomyces aberdarensis]|uniref:Uncharacterized protein n=1 Tax=Candolleomyces aberdarensis TaxID=2316362 RepID=A0A4Q2DNP9_9AGAR|nr:hypothetical protein EST38_g4867 [Candolleomyces aberdarensis]
MENTTSRSPRRASRQNGYATSSPFNLGPLPTLALNPRANRSSSSLESTGSSFHSWEGEKDKLLSVFNDAEVQPAWHDFSRSSSGKSLANSATTSTRTSPEEDWDPEDIIRGYAGLKRGDFAMIQEKLVSVARTTEHRGSALRKRRPSTSQSNYSVRDNRQVASPPPPASPTVNIYPNSREQQQIHVLNTCVEHNITPSPPIMAPSLSSSSSLDRPNRNLAQVLFGQEEEPTELDTPTNAAHSLTHSSSVDATGSIFSSFSQSSDAMEQNTLLASPNTSIQGLPSPGAISLNRNPSVTRVPPQTPQDQAALALEVRQKAEAATLALRKPPSQEGMHTQPTTRKKIDPSQISKPLLVSSSTSVDTIPLKAPVLSAGNGSGSSLKIGSRFRKLRGSLRAKNVLSPEEPAAAGSDGKHSPNSQTVNYDPEKVKSPGTPNLASATEPARFKVPVPSPPASAGPGLKGFMARFRTKRNTDVPQSSSSSISSDHHQSPQIPHSPLSPLAHPQRQFSTSSTQSRTPSHTATSDSTHTVTTPRQDQYRPQISNNVPPSQAESTTSDGTQPENDDTRAINQLFAAATNLGIDQAALNDLLKRSGSLNSRTLLSPNKDTPSSRGNGAGQQHLSVPPIQQPNLSSSSGSDYTATPGMFNSSPVSDLSIGNNFLYNEESRAAEEQTERISAKRADHLRQGKDGNSETNPIVRRTLIFADPRQSMADPSMSRRSTVRRRRASVQSASNRSIHDRVPTPPPSKAPQGKRFSHEASPPVPRLPHALGGPADNHLTVPTGQFEKSNSAAYDSLYELYGDSRVPSMMVDANSSDFGREPHTNSEMATGVEVIQLANGDIIWNVVNGLRDDDDESLYTGRNSVGSEYSTRESGENNMQVFVKEHVRGSSKGSNASFVSRKKPSGGKARPETKVLYGSPEQIGRLIENISQGMDAGTFNFSPPYSSRSNTQSHGHSTTSSVSTNEWNINEIDNLLNTINRP